jgi:hypothetical protein
VPILPSAAAAALAGGVGLTNSRQTGHRNGHLPRSNVSQSLPASKNPPFVGRSFGPLVGPAYVGMHDDDQNTLTFEDETKEAEDLSGIR